MKSPLEKVHDFGSLTIDRVTRTVARSGVVLPLTAKEFDILCCLAEHAPEPVSRETIVAEAWPGEKADCDERLRTHIRTLRRKLGKRPDGLDLIGTVPGRGYFLSIPAAVEIQSAPLPLAPRRSRLALFVSGGALLTTLLLYLVLHQDKSPQQHPPQSRLLAASTSAGRTPRRIDLKAVPEFLAFSPDGAALLATGQFKRLLSVIDTRSGQVETVELPTASGQMAVSPDGKCYIGSPVDGVMIYDILHRRLQPEILRTGGPVIGMVIDPSGANLYLAMLNHGAKKLNIASRRLSTITDRVCPVSMAIDHRGKRVYVAYQCGGPSGKNGHDQIEVFNADGLGAPIASFSGPPLVAGPMWISPDDKTLLVDASDACSARYDHAGCASVPARLTYLLNADDMRVIHTFYRPVQDPFVGFANSQKLIHAGRSISIVDARTYETLEQKELGVPIGRSVVSPSGRQLWASAPSEKAVFQFDVKPTPCEVPDLKPSMLFSGDGHFNDVFGITALTPKGAVAFRPGKTGQAFSLEGGYLLRATGTYYRLDRHDYTIAAFVDFAAPGKQVIMDWGGIELARSADGHLTFLSEPGAKQLVSAEAIEPGSWHRIAVTNAAGRIVLFIDGRPQGSTVLAGQIPLANDPFVIAADRNGAARMTGLLDELAFFNRALTAEQISRLGRSDMGACSFE